MSRVYEGLGHAAEADSANTRALAIFEKLTLFDASSQDYRDGLANSFSQRGSLNNLAGKLELSREDYLKNMQIREALAAEFPNSPIVQRNLMLAYSHLGDILGYPGLPNLGRPDAAVEYFRKCFTVAKTISAADPTDQIARFDVAMARLRLARTLLATRTPGEALEMLIAGSAESDRLLIADPQNKRYLTNVTIFHQLLGDQFRRSGESQQAAAEYDRALAAADRLRLRDPSEAGGWLSGAARVLVSYSELVGRNGDRARAASIEKRAIELAELARGFRQPLGQSHAPLLYAALGEMHTALADAAAARQWLEKSAASWQALQAAGDLPRMYAKEPARVAALLASSK
jgi:hypothetical protein